jgi:pimeloyl-ACP methyl ester carboxylesterase
MTKEPVVISVPNTDGRYYLLPMLDMWTNVFASPGWRTTGTKAGTLLLTPTGWRPDLRDRFVDEFKLPKDTQRIEAPTPYVWVIGRTKTDGPADYDAVHKIQDGYKVTLLSDFGKAPKPVEFKFDPTVDMKTPPKVQVDTMAGGKFFAYAAELLKVNPPHITDEPILARMKRIGIEAGKSFDVSQLDPIVRKAIESAPETAQELMRWKIATIARVANGWSMMTDTVGVYGNYYLKRSILTQQGLGANLVEDAIYPLNLADSEGKALDGANKYVLHFDKDQTPPAYAFWSVTLYVLFGGYAVATMLSNDMDRRIAERLKFWGTGEMLKVLSPSRATNQNAIDQFAKYQRLAASPGAIKAISLLNAQIDVRAILPNIQAPTLVLHRKGDASIPIELGRNLAALIPNAKFIEYSGQDHFYFFGDVETLLGDIEEFVTGHRESSSTDLDRVLATVLFTDIVGSTRNAATIGDLAWRRLLDSHDQLAVQTIEKYRGTLVKTTGDGILATFDGPGRAVRCALSLEAASKQMGLPLRAGSSYRRDRN